jgi:hypothetical protein
MLALEYLAEQRIRAAIERGEFDDLPGQGKPLPLEDDVGVPAELRVAYRILKNAGYVPPEIELRKDIANAEQLLQEALTPAERSTATRRLDLLLMKLAAQRGGTRDARVEAAYYDALASKLRARQAKEPL